MIQPDNIQAASQFLVRHYEISPVPVYVDTTEPFFFVLLEGEITVAYDSFPALTIRPGEFVMVLRHSCYRMTVVRPSVGMRVYNSEYFVEKCYNVFGNLSDFITKDFQYEFRALPTMPAINHFHHSIKQTIMDGNASPQLFTQWHDVMISMMALYYTPRQVAEFFYPVLASDFDFRRMVIDHSLKVKDLPELAALCHMSLSTFKRRFKRTFHAPAHTWIAARKAHFIYSEIVNTRKTFGEIAEQFNISSSAYLTVFCKQHFGQTPQEIRRRRYKSVLCGEPQDEIRAVP